MTTSARQAAEVHPDRYHSHRHTVWKQIPVSQPSPQPFLPANDSRLTDPRNSGAAMRAERERVATTHFVVKPLV